MPKRILRSDSGVTLMEVTLAVALFAVAIAMSAQALISFYAAIDVQEQRVEAMQAAAEIYKSMDSDQLMKTMMSGMGGGMPPGMDFGGMGGGFGAGANLFDGTLDDSSTATAALDELDEDE